MKKRIAVFVVVVFASLIVNNVFNDLIHPTISADLAVQQMADDEFAVVTMRGYERFANTIPVVTWGTVFLTGLALFGKPLYQLGCPKEPQ